MTNPIRIAGLASFVAALKLLCKVQNKFAPSVRAAIPAIHQAKFDNVKLAVDILCSIIDTIDYTGDGVTPPNNP